MNDDVRPSLRFIRRRRDHTLAASTLIILAQKLIKTGGVEQAAAALQEAKEQIDDLDSELAQEEETLWAKQRTIAKGKG
jgi:hypothetical protein